MDIREQYNLSNVTTFAIGGPANYFCVVQSIDDLAEALDFSSNKKIPVLILGGGSNVLISDSGFEGLVIQNQIQGLIIEDSGLVRIGAGENWDGIVNSIVKKELAGVECLSGVPGTAGGGLVQNIGAYGQTLGELVVSVEAVEISSRKSRVFSPQECEFEYRSSFFKRNPNKYIVTGFQIKLIPQGKPSTSYPHVAKHFEKNPNPSLSEVREFIIRLRGSKGYLQLPGYERYNTAGSYFKNPIVSFNQYKQLESILGSADLNRFWPLDNGVKIAAAFLMQEAGFAKGYQEGNVGISPKHSLSIINLGQAKAIEVKTFAEKIKKVVEEKFGVRLEEEVLYIGKFE